jgi:hypothetical protein
MGKFVTDAFFVVIVVAAMLAVASPTATCGRLPCFS